MDFKLKCFSDFLFTMEEKYKFIRGEHPTEKVAYLLAGDIASVLRNKGRTIEIEDVDEKRTNIWHAKQLLSGKKLKPHLSLRPGYMRAIHNPFSVFFNFHNFHWDGKPPIEEFKFRCGKYGEGGRHPYYEIDLPNYFLVELPAIFHREDKELEVGLLMLDEILEKSKARCYLRPAPNWGYCRLADVDSSRKSGLMSDKLIDFYASEIDKLAIEYFDEIKTFL